MKSKQSNLSRLSNSDVAYFTVPKSLYYADKTEGKPSAEFRLLLCTFYELANFSRNLCLKFHTDDLLERNGYTNFIEENELVKILGVTKAAIKNYIRKAQNYGFTITKAYSSITGSYVYKISLNNFEFNGGYIKVPDFIYDINGSASDIFTYLSLFFNATKKFEEGNFFHANVNKTYLINGTGLSYKTISKSLSNLQNAGLIENISRRKRKNCCYSYSLYMMESVKKDKLLSGISKIRAVINDLTLDKVLSGIKINEEKAEKFTLSKKKLSDNYNSKVLTKCIIKYKYNLNIITQEIKSVSDLTFLEDVILNKKLIQFKKMQMKYLLKEGYSKYTADRILSSLLLQYIAVCIKARKKVICKCASTQDTLIYNNAYSTDAKDNLMLYEGLFRYIDITDKEYNESIDESKINNISHYLVQVLADKISGSLINFKQTIASNLNISIISEKSMISIIS